MPRRTAPPCTLAWLLAGLLALTATPALAESLVHLSVEDLAARSEACVLARVESQQARWNETRDLIVTTYVLEVRESLAGELVPGALELHRLGGELDGLRLAYEGMPELETGEEAVIFLRQRAPNAFIVSALRQGVFHRLGEDFVRDLRGVRGAPVASERLSLESLRRRVEAGASR